VLKSEDIDGDGQLKPKVLLKTTFPFIDGASITLSEFWKSALQF